MIRFILSTSRQSFCSETPSPGGGVCKAEAVCRCLSELCVCVWACMTGASVSDIVLTHITSCGGNGSVNTHSTHRNANREMH